MDKIFTAEDYNSGDGMLTSIWGPSMWHFLHTISFNYPVNPTKQDKQSYCDYLMSLQKVLPCKYCRDNYTKNLKNARFSKNVFKNRNCFSRFIYRLHEEVNNMLGKTSNLSYNDVKNRYEHFRSRCLIDKKDKIINGKVIEKGCVDSLYGKKSKCVLNIVPTNSKIKSFKMSPKCKIERKHFKPFK